MKMKKPLLKKRGQSNIEFRGVKNKWMRYLRDIYISLLDLQWRYVIVVLLGGFTLSYFIFSIFYYAMAYNHGDLDHIGDPDFKPCIVEFEDYWDALLLSIETQSTIGFGTIYPNSDCVGAIPTVFLQVCLGFMFETLLLGFVFVKIARPKNRRHTLQFSRNACVCKEDGQLTLQIRLGDTRLSHLIDAHVTGVLIKTHYSEEKHVYPLFQHELTFEAQGMGDRVILIWPLVLKHKITPESLLYTLTPEDLLRDNFELALFLEGTVESTGEMLQAKTAYSCREILWGKRFAGIEEYDERTNKWCVDFTRFNNVVPAETPRCSAKALDEDPTRNEVTHTALNE